MTAIRTALATISILVLASPAFAQSQGIVTVDRAVIWRIDASVVAAIVDAGAVLELTGRSDRWYEVVIPVNLGGRGERGLIAITQVRLVDESAPPVERSLRGGGRPPELVAPITSSRPAPPPGPAVALRGFGQASLISFTARESFAAVTGESFGPSFGAGAQIRFRGGLYFQASVERFKKTGQRVFVFDNEVFPLGIPNTVTIEPIIGAIGYRPPTARPAQVYLGVGLGTYRLRESSPFDAAGEEIDERHLGYHVHGGVELWPRRWLVPALEVRYTTVPDGLGSQGAATEFDESDLGGWQFSGKLILGR